MGSVIKPARVRAALPLLAAVASLATAGAAHADLDLTPRYKAIDLGGAVIQRIYFSDGNKHFAVTINADMEVGAAGGGATFRFKTIPLADMSLRPSPMPATVPFSPERLPEYRRIAREQLGRNAEILKEEQPEMDVLPVNGWTSLRVNFTTRQAGLAFKTDVTFLNVSKSQQIIIVTSSKEGNFLDVRSRAHKIMNRWHQVLPGDELGLN